MQDNIQKQDINFIKITPISNGYLMIIQCNIYDEFNQHTIKHVTYSMATLQECVEYITYKWGSIK